MKVLILDSRNRVNQNSPCNTCQFALQDVIIASKFTLTSFTFANFLYNVTSSSNTLTVDGVLAATITPGFWFASNFVAELNSQLQAFYVTVADVVTLDVNTNTLTWTLPSGSLDGTMRSILGLIGSPSGNFTSLLYLIGATQLAILCPELQRSSYNSFPSTNPVIGTIPVQSGFMQIQTYEPSRAWEINFEPRVQFNALSMQIMDAHTGEVVNIGEWSATFVVS